MPAQNIQQFRVVNMLGGMNTAAEENNLLTLDPQARLGVGFSNIQTEFRLIRNWIPLNRGGLSKTFGFSLFKDVGVNTPITGICRFIKADGTNLFLVSYNTKVYKLVAGVLTDIGCTVANGAYLHFETAYDKMIVCDGVNAPQKFDGVNVSLLGGSPPAQARQALFYTNRLFMFGSTNNPALLYYSDAGSIETGYSSNFINCDVNDGQKITCIGKFFIPGQLRPVIIVGKERSVGIVTGSGTSSDPFYFQKITPDTGMSGFRHLVQYGQDAAFLTQKGVNSYLTTLNNLNLQQQLLSSKIYDQFTGLNPSTLFNALCWNDWKRRRISFAVVTGSGTYPDRVWHLDTESLSWYYQDGFRVTAAFVDTDGSLYTGDDAGKIVKHDPNVKNYNGGLINASLSTGYFDFFDPNRFKKINWASVTCRTNGSYGLGISTKRNFGQLNGSNHNINFNQSAYIWGSGQWSNDSSVYQWGGSPILRKLFYPKGIFKNIQFTFNQTGVNQPVDLFELNMEVEFLDKL
ncbi:MAG: hypothetical protein K2X66_07865 [Cyanobacteria bacterium]|nr:hypothetical protein [Cyanobacteriota bacterium]